VVGFTDFAQRVGEEAFTDDAGVALCPIRLFLNGAEVKSTIETVTTQGNEPRYFDLTPFASMIQAGTNTVAVLVSNYWSTWDDVAFDVSLKAIPYHPVLPRMAAQKVAQANPTLSVETPAGSIWQLQSSDSLSPAHWQPMQTFTNNAGGLQSFIDTGQNGRLPPAAVRSRFYRLVPF
jgi:hypothetical protein